MKSLTRLGLVAIIGMTFVGCATSYPVGSLFTEVKLPIQATPGDTSYSKVGVAKSNSILSLVATGDSSIEAAVKNGNISKIKYIDWDARNILGIFGEYTTTVYGE